MAMSFGRRRKWPLFKRGSSTISAYITAAMPASAGVIAPPRIEPMIITGIISGRTAPRSARPNSATLARGLRRAGRVEKVAVDHQAGHGTAGREPSGLLAARSTQTLHQPLAASPCQR